MEQKNFLQKIRLLQRSLHNKLKKLTGMLQNDNDSVIIGIRNECWNRIVN